MFNAAAILLSLRPKEKENYTNSIYPNKKNGKTTGQ
jgi:hypothetical protein